MSGMVLRFPTPRARPVSLPDFDRRLTARPAPPPATARDALRRADARFAAYRRRHAARTYRELFAVLEQRAGRLLPQGLPPRLFDLLIHEGLVTAEELREVGGRLGLIPVGRELGEELVAAGLITASAWRHVHAQRLGIAAVDLDLCAPDPVLSGVLPPGQMRRHLILPLCRHGLRTVMVLPDLRDREALEVARRASPSGVEFVVAPAAEIAEAIDRLLDEHHTLPGW